MKKMLFTLVTMLTIAVSANAMSYEQARNEALFLTDKMAYELNLSDAQYEAAYEINLDYLMGVTSQQDVFGPYWERRNMDLNYILYSWQWDLFRAATYFYRPLYWEAGFWHFGIYARYPHRDYFYFGRPHFYLSYRGGHSWHMNGGRSYYERHRDHFRPNVHRDNHFGMRNGWDRGDYRSNDNRSSTRVTAGHGRNDNNRPNTGNGNRPTNNHSGNFTGNRSSNMNNGRSNDSNRGTVRNSNPSNTSSNRGTMRNNNSSNTPSNRGAASNSRPGNTRNGGSVSNNHGSSRSNSNHSGGNRGGSRR